MIFITFACNMIRVVIICVILIEGALLENAVISAVEKRSDRLNFTELTDLLGLPSEVHDVETEDGYILRLDRIPGTLKPPILFVHGIELSADSWILRGLKSLPVLLSHLGHDLWFANLRGNVYSRRHIRLNPDTDKEFWEFSFHEHGYYDTAAIIDAILNETDSSQIKAIGFSEGTTALSVLLSSRPEYNSKINSSIYLAPIVYLNDMQPLLSLPISVIPQINYIMEKLGINELFGVNSRMTAIVRAICTQRILGYAVCLYGFLFPVCGYDYTQLEPEFYRISVYYLPNGTSRKNIVHFSQVGRSGRFARYDYGAPKNMVVYNSSMPSEYNLTCISSPIVMVTARGDKLATISNAETLRDRLPNVKRFVILPRLKANHLDYIWGRDMDDYLYPYILSELGY